MKRRDALKAILALPFAPAILKPDNSLKYMGTESGRWRGPAPSSMVGDVWYDDTASRLYRYHRIDGWVTVTYS